MSGRGGRKRGYERQANDGSGGGRGHRNARMQFARRQARQFEDLNKVPESLYPVCKLKGVVVILSLHE